MGTGACERQKRGREREGTARESVIDGEEQREPAVCYTNLTLPKNIKV